jgi:hypothetical protein
MKKYLLLVALFGCTDAEWGQYQALGCPGHIVCYSAEKVTYDGWASGKIATESGSDGWFFVEAKTGDLIRVSGSCVIRNATHCDTPPAGYPGGGTTGN